MTDTEIRETLRQAMADWDAQFTAKEITNYKGETELMVSYHGYTVFVAVGELERAKSCLVHAERMDTAYAQTKAQS